VLAVFPMLQKTRPARAAKADAPAAPARVNRLHLFWRPDPDEVILFAMAAASMAAHGMRKPDAAASALEQGRKTYAAMAFEAYQALSSMPNGIEFWARHFVFDGIVFSARRCVSAEQGDKGCLRLLAAEFIEHGEPMPPPLTEWLVNYLLAPEIALRTWAFRLLETKRKETGTAHVRLWPWPCRTSAQT
jgi:hypothetical protein